MDVLDAFRPRPMSPGGKPVRVPRWTTKKSRRSWVAFFWEDYCRVMGVRLPSPTRSPKLTAAVELLRRVLWAGPAREAEIERRAAAAGISWRTVKSAKRLLRVESRRVGFGPGSHLTWALLDPPPEADLAPAKLPDRRVWARYVTVAEAAELMQATPSHVRNLLEKGRLTSYKNAGRVFIDRVELEAYLALSRTSSRGSARAAGTAAGTPTVFR